MTRRLLSSRISLSVSSLGEYSPVDLCRAAELAFLESRSDKDLFRAISARAVELSKVLSPSQAAKLVYITAQGGGGAKTIHSLSSLICDACASDSISASDVRKVLSSLSRLHFDDMPLVTALLDRAVRLMSPPLRSFEPQHLLGLLRAVQRLRANHREFFLATCEALRGDIRQMSAEEVVDMAELLVEISSNESVSLLTAEIGDFMASESPRLGVELGRRWLIAASRLGGQNGLNNFHLTEIVDKCISPQMTRLSLRESLGIFFALVRLQLFTPEVSRFLQHRLLPLIRIRLRDEERDFKLIALSAEMLASLPFWSPVCDDIKNMLSEYLKDLVIDSSSGQVRSTNDDQSIKRLPAQALLTCLLASTKISLELPNQLPLLLAEGVRDLSDSAFEKFCVIAEGKEILERLRIERLRRLLSKDAR